MGCCCIKAKQCCIEPPPHCSKEISDKPPENTTDDNQSTSKEETEDHDRKEKVCCQDTVEVEDKIKNEKRNRKRNTRIIKHHKGYKVITNCQRYKQQKCKSVFPQYHSSEFCPDQRYGNHGIPSRTPSISTTDSANTYRSAYLAEPASIYFLLQHPGRINMETKNKCHWSENTTVNASQEVVMKPSRKYGERKNTSCESDVDRRLKVLRRRYKIGEASRQISSKSSRQDLYSTIDKSSPRKKLYSNTGKQKNRISASDSGVNLSVVD